jgi:pimeloyl-ACP methyl ester carboxylesterase
MERANGRVVLGRAHRRARGSPRCRGSEDRRLTGAARDGIDCADGWSGPRELGELAEYGVWMPVSLGSSRGFVLQPKITATAPRPWVWYAPTLTAGPPFRSNVWLFRGLLERGLAICGVDVGESYGSPPGRRSFSTFYQHIVQAFDLDLKVVLLPQSRGGLMHYAWAVENPDRVRRIGGIFPVCDLRSYPGLTVAAAAYGVTERELQARLPDHNPVANLRRLAEARIPILHVHGDKDALVPMDANSEALRRKYAELGGDARVIVVPGRGHEEAAELFEVPELLDFLSARWAETDSRR